MSFKFLPLRFAGQIETVPTFADLPPPECAVEGAIRWVEDTNEVWFFDGTAWTGLTVDTLNADCIETDKLIVNDLALIRADIVEIGDNIIVLNSEHTGAPTENAGLEIERGAEPNQLLIWNETTDTWQCGTAGDLEDITKSKSASANIASTASADLDTILLADLKFAKYYVNIRGGTEAKTFEFNVYKNGAGALEDIVSHRAGTIDVAIAAVVSGSNMAVRVTNNEAFAVDVDVLRFEVG